jgi:hypothetical protein
VKLVGEITERSNMKELLGSLAVSPVVLDLAAVKRINSAGIREWIDFDEALSKRAPKVTLERCSVAFVHQLNMIEGFSGNAPITSAFAPYFCTKCNSEHAELIDLQEKGSASPIALTLPCSKCGGPMEFDDLPEYLSFSPS